MEWQFEGANVQVPRTADIPPQFWTGGMSADVVQQALDMVDPWKNGDNPIVTVELENGRHLPIIVPLRGRKPWWGIYAGHHARQPGASPFLRVDLNRLERTNLFTVELTQSPRSPKLVRAYPGEYIPPLPWMYSARDAPGGEQACRSYWRTHAYVLRRSTMRNRAHEPAWFRR